MENCPRIVLFPEDLSNVSGGGNKTLYRLYNTIRDSVGLRKGIRITIYHVRDYFKISLEDVIHGVFGEKHINH